EIDAELNAEAGGLAAADEGPLLLDRGHVGEEAVASLGARGLGQLVDIIRERGEAGRVEAGRQRLGEEIPFLELVERPVRPVGERTGRWRATAATTTTAGRRRVVAGEATATAATAGGEQRDRCEESQ